MRFCSKQSGVLCLRSGLPSLPGDVRAGATGLCGVRRKLSREVKMEGCLLLLVDE